MKNFKKSIQLLLIFIGFTINLNCVDDSKSDVPNKNINEDGTILKSYVSDNGSAQIVHVFGAQGTRYDKILKYDGSIGIQYVYNANNKMTEIIQSPDDTYPDKTLFTYDNSGKIVQMQFDNRSPGSTGTLKTWLFTYNGNEIIQELVSDIDPNYNHDRIRYKFNTDGLLVSKHKYSDSPNNTYITTQYYQTFQYDNNKNIILRKATQNATHDLPDSPINNPQTEIITYEYDDKINPIHTVLMNHYLNHIFSFIPNFNVIQGNLQDRVLGAGKNNLTRSIASFNPQLGTPIDNDYKNVITYQSNNLPSKLSRVSIVDNIEVSSVTISYDN